MYSIPCPLFYAPVGSLHHEFHLPEMFVVSRGILDELTGADLTDGIGR